MLTEIVINAFLHAKKVTSNMAYWWTNSAFLTTAAQGGKGNHILSFYNTLQKNPQIYVHIYLCFPVPRAVFVPLNGSAV